MYTEIGFTSFAASRSGSTAKLFINGGKLHICWNCSYSTNQTRSSDIHIGTNVGDGSLSSEGFISNLRVVKGTALYTEDFIPPTRELKKVPGTVLLCCQDPDNPTHRSNWEDHYGLWKFKSVYGTDLVTNGQFTADSDWTIGTQWTISGGSASTGQMMIVSVV